MNFINKEFFWVYNQATFRPVISGIFLHLFLGATREEKWHIAIAFLLLSIFMFELTAKKSAKIEIEIFYNREKFQKSLLSLMGYSVAIYVLTGVSIGIVLQFFEFGLTSFLIVVVINLVSLPIHKKISSEVSEKINYDPELQRCK